MRIDRFSKILFPVLAVAWLFLPSNPCFAVETAPRITDREIVERLSRLEEGQKSMNKRFEDMSNRIGDLRSDMNRRFDTLQWMIGLFITIALAIFAAIGKVLWDLNRARASMETSLETQKDEIAFLKSLIEKLLPPKGVL